MIIKVNFNKQGWSFLIKEYYMPVDTLDNMITMLILWANMMNQKEMKHG